MIFTEPKPFAEAIESREVKTILPTTADTAQLSRIAPELRERAMFSARVTSEDFLRTANDLVTRIISPETIKDPVTGQKRPALAGEYMDPATARLQLKQKLMALGYQPDPSQRGGLQDLSSDARLNLIIKTNSDMARNFAYFEQGQDPAILDAWPAQELFRAEVRNEPRNWLDRWVRAGGRVYGDRMIALKNDPVWETISAFGLPYPPFDFNSGMDVRDVARDEAIELGVIQPDQRVPPMPRGLNEDLEVPAPERSDSLFEALLQSLGKSAVMEDGILSIV